MFASSGKNNEEKDEGGESSDGAYKDDQEEPPTVVELGEDVTDNSPFKKNFEKNCDKFKIATPEAEKKNLGQGKISIQCGLFGEVNLYKLVFRNAIGKTLFEANISGKFSKIRKVPEKAGKNQVKVAIVKINAETKAPCVKYCLINFSRASDLDEFEKMFKSAMQNK